VRIPLSVTLILAVFAVSPAGSLAQGKWNFPDRKAIVLDVCPHVKITSFTFENTLEGRTSSSRNSFKYEWKNVSSLPVLARLKS